MWWHQDWWCWDHPISYEPRAAQVAVLIYLTPTDEESAALRVLPGSHREMTALHAVLPEAHARTAEELDPAHPAMTDHPEQVTLRLAPGDAVVMDYRLLHGTHPNRRPTRRDCVLLTFAPSWRALPEEIRGHLIRHPALPEEPAQPWLPSYEGARADLRLNRAAFVARVSPGGLRLALPSRSRPAPSAGVSGARRASRRGWPGPASPEKITR